MYRPSSVVAAIIALSIAGILASPGFGIGTTAPSWEPRQLVAERLEPAYPPSRFDSVSLAYDHWGHPGLAYTLTDNNLALSELYYARHMTGFGWGSRPLVESEAPLGSASMAFDRHERPAIGYREGLASWTGASWSFNSTEGGGRLAFDLYGTAAIAQARTAEPPMESVRFLAGPRDAGGFDTVETVAEWHSGGAATTTVHGLAFDALNRPIVAYSAPDPADPYGAAEIALAIKDPAVGWMTTTLDRVSPQEPWEPIPSIHASLAIDPDTGIPVVAYSVDGAEGSELYYIEWNGSAWNRSVLASGGRLPSLQFDPGDGHPAVAYVDAATGALELSWHDGDLWQSQTVDDQVRVSGAPSLAFNDYGTGFPSIAYFTDNFDAMPPEAFRSSLYFIEDPAPLPEPSAFGLLFLGAGLACVRRRAIVLNHRAG